MKNKKSFCISFILLSIFSTLFHFLYDVTHFFPFKIIAPMNESVWEHSKILIVPFLIFAIIYYIIKKPQRKLNYFAATAKASIIMQLVMITLYYTYSGIIGRGYLVCDIILTYVCVFIGLFTFFNTQDKESKFPKTLISLLLLQLILIIVFTFWQPNLAIFISAV